MLLQEFDLLFKDIKGTKNHIAYDLPRLEDFPNVNEGEQIKEEFSDEKLTALDISQVSSYANILNLIMSGNYPSSSTPKKKKYLNHDAKFYIWDKAFFFKKYVDRVMRRFPSGS